MGDFYDYNFEELSGVSLEDLAIEELESISRQYLRLLEDAEVLRQKGYAISKALDNHEDFCFMFEPPEPPVYVRSL